MKNKRHKTTLFGIDDIEWLNGYPSKLSIEVQGALMRLLAWSWVHGPIEYSPSNIQKILKIPLHKVGDIMFEIDMYFDIENGYMTSFTVECEKERKQAVSASKAVNGSKGGTARVVKHLLDLKRRDQANASITINTLKLVDGGIETSKQVVVNEANASNETVISSKESKLQRGKETYTSILEVLSLVNEKLGHPAPSAGDVRSWMGKNRTQLVELIDEFGTDGAVALFMQKHKTSKGKTVSWWSVHQDRYSLKAQLNGKPSGRTLKDLADETNKRAFGE